MQLGLLMVQAGDAEGTDLTLETRSRSKLSVKVSGDLNAEEYAAIQDTVARAIELADDFFAGDVQAAFESAAALDIDGEQLARVRIRMRIDERLTYSAQGFLPALPIAGEIAETSDASTHTAQSLPTFVSSSTPAPARTQVAPAASGTTAGTNEIVEPELESPEPAPENPEGAQGGVADPAKLFQAYRVILDFLGQVLDAVRANDGEAPAGVLDVSLKIRIVQSTLVTLSQARAEEEAPLPELVPETLDALAAQEEAPPLDQMA